MTSSTVIRRRFERRDTSANWSNTNPVLGPAEWAYEADTGRVKIGDGSTPWNSLGYFISDPSVLEAAVNEAKSYADSAIEALELGTASTRDATDFEASGYADSAIEALNLDTASTRPASDFAMAWQGGLAETALQPDSDTGKLPAEMIPDAVLGALNYQGLWDASANLPAIPPANTGNAHHYYVVNVAGAHAVDGISDWSVGDALVSNGAAWERLPGVLMLLLAANLDIVLNNRQAWIGMQRNGVAGFPWCVLDQTKKILLGLASDGALHAWRLVMTATGTRHRTAYPYHWWIEDAEHKCLMGLRRADGLFEIMGKIADPDAIRDAATATIGQPEVDYGRSNGSPYLWTIQDAEGKIPLGIKADGTIFALLDKPSITHINDAGYIPPKLLSQSNNYYFNIRETKTKYVFTACDRAGFSFDVVRLKNPGSNLVDLIDHASALLFSPFMGQSNAGNYHSSAYEGSHHESSYPNSAVCFGGGKSIVDDTSLAGENILDESTLSFIVPLRDTYGQYLATVASLAMEDVARQYGRATPGTLTATYWWSGQNIAKFVRGTNGWDTIMKFARKSKERAADYGRAAQCKWITYIQGENASPGYKTALVDFATDIRTELKTQMGHGFLPEFLYVQINSPDTASAASGIEQSQLDAYLENMGAGMTLVGPMYHCPLGDTIHITSIGRMVLAENIAIAQSHVLLGKQFKPLYPISATLAGNIIDIVFNVPGTRLFFDTDWVAPVSNFGFSYKDDMDSADISSVEILNKNTVRITLSSTPTGENPKVLYAVLTDTQSDGWANGRGQLYSKSNIASFYYKNGYDVPEHTRHYCVRFTMVLS